MCLRDRTTSGGPTGTLVLRERGAGRKLGALAPFDHIALKPKRETQRMFEESVVSTQVCGNGAGLHLAVFGTAFRSLGLVISQRGNSHKGGNSGLENVVCPGARVSRV